MSKLKQYLTNNKGFIIVFLLVFVSDDTVLFGTNNNSLFIYLKYAVVSFLLAYFFVKSKKKAAYCKRPKGILLFLILLVVLSGVINFDFTLGYPYKIILMLLAYYYCSTTPYQNFGSSFVDCMTFIAAYSLVSYVIYTLSPSLVSWAPVITNSSELEFRNLLFCVVPDTRFSGRLFGPFREPGVYQALLNIAIIFHVQTSSKVSIGRIALFVISIILTQSTTGFLVMALSIAYIFVNNTNKSKVSYFFIAILLLCGALYLANNTTMLDSDGSVFGKLQDQDRESTIARMASVTCNLKIIGMDPLFGVGLSNLSEIFPMLCMQEYHIYNVSNTNMLLIQFASHGILFGILWFIGVLNFTLYSSRETRISKLLWIAIILLLCVGENLAWDVLFSIILMYGYFMKSNKDKANCL